MVPASRGLAGGPDGQYVAILSGAGGTLQQGLGSSTVRDRRVLIPSHGQADDLTATAFDSRPAASSSGGLWDGASSSAGHGLGDNPRFLGQCEEPTAFLSATFVRSISRRVLALSADAPSPGWGTRRDDQRRGIDCQRAEAVELDRLSDRQSVLWPCGNTRRVASRRCRRDDSDAWVWGIAGRGREITTQGAVEWAPHPPVCVTSAAATRSAGAWFAGSRAGVQVRTWICTPLGPSSHGKGAIPTPLSAPNGCGIMVGTVNRKRAARGPASGRSMGRLSVGIHRHGSEG